MRRMMSLGLGLVLAGCCVGCKCTMGVCDCDNTPLIPCPCWTLAGAPGVAHPIPAAPGPAAPGMKPEPIREMPRPQPEAASTPDK